MRDLMQAAVTALDELWDEVTGRLPSAEEAGENPELLEAIQDLSEETADSLREMISLLPTD